MNARNWLVLGLVAGIAACGGSDTDPLDTADAGGGEPDAAGPDAAGPDAAACPTGGEGMLAVEIQIEADVPADVQVTGAGAPRTLTAAETLTLPAGPYEISARRVMKAGLQVGAAYQPSVQTEQVCVRADMPGSARVVYTREPGSNKLWLTQTNGSGAQVMAFDADQLLAAGDQTPSVGLETKEPSAGTLRVDALGRLWVGTTDSLVAFNTERLATSSSTPPDVILDGPTICGPTLPCGPRAIAFDKAGAMWVALPGKVVKLSPESIAASGKPSAAVTITSPALDSPSALALDAAGNLWVADLGGGGVLQFAASRLGANIVEGAPDVEIFADSGPPVFGTLRSPEGLAFDAAGNLWVGYFAGNELVRFTPAQLAVSHPKDEQFVPSPFIKLGALALVTDLAIDEGGNLWLPSRAGELARIDQAQLSLETPAVVTLRSAEIGSVEKLTLHAVSGDLFIAP